MSTFVTIQTAPVPDGVEPGASKLPYPFHADITGAIRRQDFWQGKPARVIGICSTPDTGYIDKHWQEIWRDPTVMVGKYLVTADDTDFWSTHLTAVDSVTVTES